MKVEKSEKFNGVCDVVVGGVSVIYWKSVTIKNTAHCMTETGDFI